MLVGAALLVPVAVSAAGAQESDDASAGTVIVLVDLSGSLTRRDITEEIRAVGVMNTIPDIDIWVIGFASDGSLPAAVVVCEPGDDLDVCTTALGARTNTEGNDTDHAAALEAAADVLGPAGPDGSPPSVVLLLTDGEFDPSGSGNPSDEERVALSTALGSLRDAGVSVWPLGFGNVTRDELNALAIAAPGSCREARGVLVAGSRDIPEAVSKIIGLADCSKPISGGKLDVSPETDVVIVTYGENELSNPTVIVRTDERKRGRFDCVFDDLAGVWTCEIPTASLGAGTWELIPTPSQFPTPYQQEASTTETSTTTDAPSTTTTSTASETTTTQQVTTTAVSPSSTVASEAAAPVDESASFPWVIVAAIIVGAAIIGGAVVLSRRTDRSV
jgi:hypothetical protein